MYILAVKIHLQFFFYFLASIIQISKKGKIAS